MHRREFLTVPVVAGGLMALSNAETADSEPATVRSNHFGVKALVFDVFGTVVDWRGSIIREGEQWGKEKGLAIDWGKFADEWRAGYGPSMNNVRKGELPWTKLDDLHRMILEDLLKEYKITGLTEEEKEHWTRVWHRLRPWPDSVEGLTRLKKNHVIATLSNGNVSLLLEMAKFGGLPWDTIFGSDIFHHFKPDREVYLGAADLLSYKPAEVMMTAAHPDDLKAAQSCGLKTAFVARPLERGPAHAGQAPGPMAPSSNSAAGGGTTPASIATFDVTARDFIELAAKLA
jgi:2-haloacid dehalogenase